MVLAWLQSRLVITAQPGFHSWTRSRARLWLIRRIKSEIEDDCDKKKDNCGNNDKESLDKQNNENCTEMALVSGGSVMFSLRPINPLS